MGCGAASMPAADALLEQPVEDEECIE